MKRVDINSFVQVYQVMYYWLLKVKREHINSFCTSISGNVLLITESEKSVILIVFVQVYQVMYYWLLKVKRVHINSFCTSISGNVLLITESEKSAY